ncbi:hypothetical protein GALMADRAFT_141452 [Galerina marginata CBS 339.88]|uniref:Caspase family p20 domain-containing protein n=1 Tax=Galerina marginata (strain CBS 339.88) TaxID=685588 RepID=A0A067T3A6_GALM3|nr:hypothetical protein GALMADRAFT_141452 [Galerina marginata CBS 339.88]
MQPINLLIRNEASACPYDILGYNLVPCLQSSRSPLSTLPQLRKMDGSTSHLFGLLIGINAYKSSAFPSLRGAVADARAVAAYLQDQLNVPKDHLTILENESATRAAILKQLRCLATDARIRRGDLIIIFYAGYGSETAAPLGWEVGGQSANIQLTLPYDACCESGEEVVAPILDCTFGVLLSAIAQEKGDNIVVIMDSCHSASGLRAFNESSDFVRCVPLPPSFQFLGSPDAGIGSSYPTNNSLRSHVRLSACGPSDQAWEADGRGVFTVALLNFLKDNHEQNNKLRYCDIVMQMDIDPKQSPCCEGLNQERSIFTTTSPPPIEYFIPAYTRTSKNGSFAYFLNGGTAHGLIIGDEFGIYSDMDSPEPEGTLVVDEVGSFYSILRYGGKGIPITGNAIALCTKQGKRRPFRIHSRSHSSGTVLDIPSLLDSSKDFSNFVVASSLEECDLDVSVEDPHTIFRLRNIRGAECLCVQPTSEELARILKASSRFFSELDHTADFPDITQHIEVKMYEFARALTTDTIPPKPVPYESHCFALRAGYSYCLQLTNKSPYDLYPTVHHFDPKDEFKFDIWYRPACTQSRLDAPLKKSGGSLTIAYGSSISPFVIPFTDKEGLANVFLKVSLFTRPLDPFYESQSFRFARHLPETHKGPWATIIKRVRYCSIQESPDGEELSIDTSSLRPGLRNTESQSSDILDVDKKNSGFSSHPEPKTKVPSGPEHGDLKTQATDPGDDRSSAGLLLRVFTIYLFTFIFIDIYEYLV